ncbi:MAG: rhomboid family intramembrane serine protease [Thermofilaceae archaeon]
MFPISDEVKKKTTPILTYFLVLSNVSVFAYSLIRGIDVFIDSYGYRPIYLGQCIRLETLLTSLFLHGGVEHLIGNLLFLYVFGRSVEDEITPLPFITLYLVSGLAGNLLHTASVYLLSPSLTGTELTKPVIGASGAISGVLGAYIVLHPHARIKTVVVYYYLLLLHIPVRFYVLTWFLYQLAIGILSLGFPLGIAAWAHVGGFAAGAMIGTLIKK